jgi:crotonobetainyl-CoA:carnitine CoA-transferase CaiB-like acyl-CoA transferase
MRDKESAGPLAGLKVIELAHIMAGPVCGLMLADMGADIIKVEKIPGGDDSRRFVPPAIDGESAAFMMMNRNKRAPVLGEHSRDILAVHGYSVAEIEGLAKDRVVLLAQPQEQGTKP